MVQHAQYAPSQYERAATAVGPRHARQVVFEHRLRCSVGDRRQYASSGPRTCDRVVMIRAAMDKGRDRVHPAREESGIIHGVRLSQTSRLKGVG